ncbi:MAG: hypothetical protein Q9M36_04315 [Sulfurovum sp.]|nr:hypothetical protein [Sulfurovum sp.]
MLGIILRFLLLLHFSLPFVYADIDIDIEAIQKASIEERFKLMNAFKKNLIKMKEKERINALRKLTRKSNHTHAQKALARLEENIKREKIRQHLEYQQLTIGQIVIQTEEYEGEDDDDD